MTRKFFVAMSVCLLTVAMLSGQVASVLADDGIGDSGMPSQIMDRHDLAAYQATLPDSFVAPAGPAFAETEPFDQIMDRQDLATYQATLTDQPQGQPFEGVVDLAVSPDN